MSKKEIISLIEKLTNIKLVIRPFRKRNIILAEKLSNNDLNEIIRIGKSYNYYRVENNGINQIAIIINKGV